MDNYKINGNDVISERNETVTFTGKNFSSQQITSNVKILQNGITTLNCTESNYFISTVLGASTWYAINVPQNCLYIAVLELNNGGLGTQTWFSNTKWSNGAPPTLTTSGTDILVFLTDDGGSTWYGSLNNKNVT